MAPKDEKPSHFSSKAKMRDRGVKINERQAKRKNHHHIAPYIAFLL
jgi:hypothetical protein